MTALKEFATLVWLIGCVLFVLFWTTWTGQ
jgi:hypothetical protein